MSQENPPGEPVTRGEGAEGFPHGSKYPLFVGAGLFFIGLGLSLTWLALIIGVPVLLYGLGGWTWEYGVEEYEAGIIPEQKRQILGVETGLLGMYFLILSEILAFAGFFVAWFYLDATRGPFPPGDLPGPSLTLGTLMTLILIVGSITARYGRNSIEKSGNRNKLVTGYALSVISGLVFLGILGLEWSNLMAEGVKWTTGAYGASYFALTGLHAGHLIAGIVMFGIVLYRAGARNHFSENRNLMVRTTEAYWHFLTAISIAILLFVYFGV
ncbi:MAG: heme-copper oxidase subunit III [Halobacteriaceae archaeon]